jgi:hypothetical protein
LVLKDDLLVSDIVFSQIRPGKRTPSSKDTNCSRSFRCLLDTDRYSLLSSTLVSSISSQEIHADNRVAGLQFVSTILAFYLYVHSLGRHRPCSRKGREEKSMGQVVEALGVLHVLLPCIVSAITLTRAMISPSETMSQNQKGKH